MKWPRKARITLIKASKGKIKEKGEIHGWDGNKIGGHDSFVAFVWLLLRNSKKKFEGIIYSKFIITNFSNYFLINLTHKVLLKKKRKKEERMAP